MAFEKRRALFLLPILASILVAAAKEQIPQHASVRDLIADQSDSLIPLLDHEEEELQHRSLTGELQQFGERCGNHNPCVQGQDCAPAGLGKRCLPNTCLQENGHLFTDGFDIDAYKHGLYAGSGYTEDQILGALSTARDERDFMAMPEFRALAASLHSNLEPLQRMQELSSACVSPNQDQNTVSYQGLHIEASAIFDISFQYLVATNSVNATDTRTVLRLCLGAELGVGAEISYVFGFANTDQTSEMLCAGWYSDLDIVILLASGAAIGVGFNGVFYFEATFGGGLGLGIGTGFCAGFEENNSTVPGL